MHSQGLNNNNSVPVVFLDRHSPCCLASFHALIPAVSLRDEMLSPDEFNPECFCSFCGHSFRLTESLDREKFDAIVSSLHEANDSDISNMIENDFPVDPQTYPADPQADFVHNLDDDAVPFDYFGDYIND
jgi:hypothetical protein